jgi:hypothetical protein
MECFDEKIKINIKKLIDLLRENNVLDWTQVFEKFLYDFNNEQDKKAVAKSIINIYRGGMGSFSDLILQKNMKMLIKENDILAALKHELFNDCLSFINADKKIS